MQSTRIGLRVQYLAMEVATSAQTDEVSFPIMASFIQANVWQNCFLHFCQIHILFISRFPEPFDVNTFPQINIFKFVFFILYSLFSNIRPVSPSFVYISEYCLFSQDEKCHFWLELLACLSWFSLSIWSELSIASPPLVKGKRLVFGWQQLLLVQRSKEATAVETKTARSM